MAAAGPTILDGAGPSSPLEIPKLVAAALEFVGIYEHFRSRPACKAFRAGVAASTRRVYLCAGTLPESVSLDAALTGIATAMPGIREFYLDFMGEDESWIQRWSEKRKAGESVFWAYNLAEFLRNTKQLTMLKIQFHECYQEFSELMLGRGDVIDVLAERPLTAFSFSNLGLPVMVPGMMSLFAQLGKWEGLRMVEFPMLCGISEDPFMQAVNRHSENRAQKNMVKTVLGCISHLHRLEWLNVQGSGCTDDDVAKLLANLHELRHLNLGHHFGDGEDHGCLSDKSMAVIAKNCPALTSLEIFDNPRITVAGVLTVTRACRELRTIDLGKTGVRPQDFPAIAASSRSLVLMRSIPSKHEAFAEPPKPTTFYNWSQKAMRVAPHLHISHDLFGMLEPVDAMCSGAFAKRRNIGKRVLDSCQGYFDIALDSWGREWDACRGVLFPECHPCLACGKRSAENKTCGRCKRVWFCDRKCQRKAWKKGHKNVCGVP